MKRPLYITLGFYFAAAFTVGVGVTLGITVTIIPIEKFLEEKEIERDIKDYRHYYDGDAKLNVIEYSEVPVPNKCSVDILGTVKNEGEYAWKSLVIEAEFFTKEGRFNDQCKVFEMGLLTPGDVNNFAMECGSCERRPLNEYERVSVKVTNASYIRDYEWKREPNKALQSTAFGGD